jgi:hypothetical protein
MLKKLRLRVLIAMLFAFPGCYAGCLPPKANAKKFIIVPPAKRQAPPDPVYSRLTWEHEGSSVPPVSDEAPTAPMLSPTFQFKVNKATLEQTIKVLAQKVGYGYDVPAVVASRIITIQTSGNVEEIVDKVAQLGHVRSVVDHEARIIKIEDAEVQADSTIPTLPAASL